MFFLIFWVVGLLLAAIHIALKRPKLNRRQAIETFLLYQFAFGFGITGLFAFAGHALNPVRTAEGIGWTPHPQFQLELAAFELGFALAAFLCLFIRNKYYWLGVAIAPSVFFVVAAVQHVYEAAAKGNLAPYNVVTAAPDILIPATILALLALYFRATKFDPLPHL